MGADEVTGQGAENPADTGLQDLIEEVYGEEVADASLQPEESPDQGEVSEDAESPEADDGAEPDEAQDGDDEADTGSSAPPKPSEIETLREQLAQLEAARNEDLTYAELGRAYLRAQQEGAVPTQQPARQDPHEAEVREALELLHDPTISDADKGKRFAAYGPEVQRKTQRRAQEVSKRQLQLSLDPEGYVRDYVAPHVERLIEQVSRPMREQSFWQSIHQRFPGAIQTDADRTQLLQGLAKGNQPEVVVALMEANRKLAKLGVREQKQQRREKDFQATKNARRRAQTKQGQRTGQPKLPMKNGVIDLEAVYWQAKGQTPEE